MWGVGKSWCKKENAEKRYLTLIKNKISFTEATRKSLIGSRLTLSQTVCYDFCGDRYTKITSHFSSARESSNCFVLLFIYLIKFHWSLLLKLSLLFQSLSRVESSNFSLTSSYCSPPFLMTLIVGARLLCSLTIFWVANFGLAPYCDLFALKRKFYISAIVDSSRSDTISD